MPGIGFSTTAFNPVIDGTWKNFKTDYGAVGDGVASEATPVATWLADTAATKLYMPPGVYNLPGSSNALTNGKTGPVTISAYGATVNDLWVGPIGGIQHVQNVSARANTVSAGSSQITLKTHAQASRFAVDSYAIMSGLNMQATQVGYPPNWYYFEYVKILSADTNSGVVTFTKPLRYTYLDTWPDINAYINNPADTDQGGPPTLSSLLNWDTNVAIYGLTILTNNAINVSGRNILLANCYAIGAIGWNVSICETCTIQGGYIGNQPEFDKLVSKLQLIQCGGLSINIQSSNDEFLMHNLYLSSTLLGTFRKNTIQGNTVFGAQMRCGPAGFGATESIYVDNSVLPAASKIADGRCQIANITFVGGSTGTWKIAKAGHTLAVDTFIATFIPGRKLAYCFFGGSTTLNKDGGGTQTFTCTSQYEDASFFYADTTLGPTQPTPLYGGVAPNYITNWGADTGGITEINSGPADITVFAAH